MYFSIFVYAVVVPIVAMYADNDEHSRTPDAVPDRSDKTFVDIFSCVVLIPLSLLSAFTCYNLVQKMKFGGLKKMLPKIYVMEFMLQTILIARITMTFA